MMTISSAGRYEIAAQEDRSAPRTRLTIPAQIRVSGGRRFQTVVHDLSLSGFSATSINRLQPGTICWITLPGLEGLASEVIWWEGNLVGCAFQCLLNPIIHNNVLKRHNGGEQSRT